MDWMQIIQTLGFPIACVVGLALWIYYSEKRNKDEAHAREDKLIEANTRNSTALEKVAETIHESNTVNKELSETNRLLVEKMEEKLDGIGSDVGKILTKLDK